MTTQHIRMRAVRRTNDEVVLGVGTRAPQTIGGLSNAEARALVQAGALTCDQWGRLHTSKPPSSRWVVDLVAEAVHAIAPSGSPLGRLVVTGEHATAFSIAGVLRELADETIHAERVDPLEAAFALGLLDPQQLPDLVIITAHEVVSPHAVHTWQRLGVAHLPVAFTGDGFTIGPYVQDSNDPCCICADLDRTDHDPSWPRIAAQFSATAPPPALCPPDVAAHAGGVLGAIVRGISQGDPPPPGLLVAARAGSPTTTQHLLRRHPACGQHQRHATAGPVDPADPSGSVGPISPNEAANIAHAS